MTDLARLTEALEQYRLRGGRVASQAAKDGIGTDLVVIERAARLVVDGQDVRWCEVHKASGLVAGMCDIAAWSLDMDTEPEPDPCRIVSARLVFPKAGT